MIQKPKSKTKKAIRKAKNPRRKPVKVIRQPAQKSKLTVKGNIPASKMLERSNVNDQVRSTSRPVPKPGHRKDDSIAVINRISHRQQERERNLQILKRFLLSRRAGGCCEIPYCGSARNLQAAHIIERSVGGKDTAGNILIACGNCHDHQKYPHGLPISQEDALILVTNLNREHSISNFLTGDLIPNGGEIND